MEVQVAAGDVVLPGDVIGKLQEDSKVQIRLGPGLRQDQASVIATRAGKLRPKHHTKFTVDSNFKRVRMRFVM